MNGKSQYPVFFKNHAAVTPELVVNRLRRINTYIWLFNKSYSQFVQKTFGNTGQQQDAIRISAQLHCTTAADIQTKSLLTNLSSDILGNVIITS